MEIKIEISSIGMPYRGLIIKRFHERSRFQDTGYNEGEKVEGMVLKNAGFSFSLVFPFFPRYVRRVLE